MLDSNGKSDKELQEATKLAQGKDIQLIWQTPCLEGVFLRILKGGQFINKNSDICKSTFNKEYLREKKVLSDTLLKKLFTKDILNSKRQEIPELDQLIQLMEKKGNKN